MILMYPPLITIILSVLLELIVLSKFKKILIPFHLYFIVINIITNIAMNNLLGLFSHYYWGLIILELAVFLLEGLIYTLLLKNYKLAFLISLSCNVVSLIGGLLFNVFLGG